MKDIRSVVDCMVRRIRNIVAVLAIALISLLGGGRAMAQEYLYPFQSVEHGSRKISMELGAGVGALYTGIGRISSSDVTLASHLGFVGHFDMGVVIGRYFAIESEIIYQKVRFDATYRGKFYDVRTSTVEMPVMFSLRLWDGILRLNGGVSLGILSSGGYTEGYEALMFGATTPTWNLTAGVGVYVARALLVELRYTHAMQDNVNQLGGTINRPGVDFSTRTHKVSLGATILF